MRTGYLAHKNKNMKRTAQQRKAAYSKRRKTQQTVVLATPYARRRSTPELKFFDTTKAGTAVATAGTIFDSSLLLMQEGNTDSTRIGNKIQLKSLMIRGTYVVTSATPAAGSNVVRIIVYQDRQANGATAAVTDILNTADYRSFNNMDNTDRFRTLCEEVIEYNCQSAAGDGTANVTSEQVRTFFLKKRLDIPIKYKGNAGTIADVASNNIGVLVIAREATGAVEYIARCKYVDY